MDKKIKVACICLGAVVGALAIGYGVGAYYYKDRFFPNVTINGIDVAGLQKIEAEEKVSVPDADEITIKERNNKEETIALSDIDYEVSADTDNIEGYLQKQNLFAWPVHLFDKVEYTIELSTSYDESKLSKALSKLSALDEDKMEEPKDAYVDQNEEGIFEVVKEEDGTTLTLEKVETAVNNALKENQLSVDLDKANCYEEASVKSDDENLQHIVNVMHALNNEVITLDLEDGVTEVISPETLTSLFTLNDDGSATLDSAALTQYVYDLADKYDTQYKVRDFVTTSGSQIQVGGGSSDTYGYQMNLSATIDLLTSVLTSKQTQTTSLYWTQTAVNRGVDKLNDFGDTYIEISISSQHLWAYIDGSLYLESDIITGLPEHNQSTPTGAFRIWNKQLNATLKGTSWDGSTWDSPVSYWMPITWTGVGLHDATWQSAFGGSLYLTRGSHGCVNLPLSVAASIYNAFEVNTPVIIY